MSDVIVKKSFIQDKGVFANRDFKRGEIVIEWKACSKVLTPKEVFSLSESDKKFVQKISDSRFLLLGSPARYVNHSCCANTRVVGESDVAGRDIKKGEEITGDYEQESQLEHSFSCNCGAPNCRKLICVK